MTEHNTLQDGGKEYNANEYDVTTATQKTLNNDEANFFYLSYFFYYLNNI